MNTPADPVDRIVTDLIVHLESLKDDGVTEIEISRKGPTGSMPMPASSGPQHNGGMVTSDVHVASSPVPENHDITARKEALAAIAARIAVCTQCALHKKRTKTVPGQGYVQPDILFVGEGPGADEDLQGLAFVGRAGQLLTRLITRMGYRREDVFIANVVKCRPPENRKPLPEEMQVCLPFLKEQIAILNPKAIVTLGATALEGLIPTLGKVFITRLRGQWMEYENIPLMPTLHPSYLLRNRSAMWDVWNDMQDVLKRLGRTPPAKKPG